jgi:hypothetical protein
MCQQEHLCLALHLSRGIVFWRGIQNDAHILADVAKEQPAIKSAAGISENLGSSCGSPKL